MDDFLSIASLAREYHPPILVHQVLSDQLIIVLQHMVRRKELACITLLMLLPFEVIPARVLGRRFHGSPLCTYQVGDGRKRGNDE